MLYSTQQRLKVARNLHMKNQPCKGTSINDIKLQEGRGLPNECVTNSTDRLRGCITGGVPKTLKIGMTSFMDLS